MSDFPLQEVAKHWKHCYTSNYASKSNRAENSGNVQIFLHNECIKHAIKLQDCVEYCDDKHEYWFDQKTCFSKCFKEDSA